MTSVATRPSISLVVPAFNEEENIGPTIEKACPILEEIASSWEIVVVNDGSRDGTAEVVKKYQAADPRVRLVDLGRNRGMGAAVRTGMEAATQDWVFETCADLQFDLDEMRLFLPYLDASDMVIGYRVNLRSGLLRSLVTSTYRLVGRALFDLSVKDPSWVKMFRREHVPVLRMESDGFFWETEILVRARLARLRLSEVGVHWHPRTAGQAQGSNPRRVLEAVMTMITFWWRGVRPVADERRPH